MAHQALRRQIDISLGRLPGRSWQRHPVGGTREASGWIRFALTTISIHPLICGDVSFLK